MGRKADSTVRARKLRHDSTDSERLLWAHLRNRHLGGFRFVRQYPIGPYFADFACRDAMLVVEIDGGQHSASAYDLARDRFMNEAGYSVLRYWNADVTRNLSGVLETLLLILQGRPSPGLRYAPATLSRARERGPTSGSSTRPRSGRGWRATPGEGLRHNQETD